ncbi:hypothetical protein EMIT0232MI5_10062 [Pseudomonas sp. IT-232MI5]
MIRVWGILPLNGGFEGLHVNGLSPLGAGFPSIARDSGCMPVS